MWYRWNSLFFLSLCPIPFPLDLARLSISSASISREWEQSVAASIPDARWIGGGRSPIDVWLPESRTGIDVGRLAFPHGKTWSHEKSMVQFLSKPLLDPCQALPQKFLTIASQVDSYYYLLLLTPCQEPPKLVCLELNLQELLRTTQGPLRIQERKNRSLIFTPPFPHVRLSCSLTKRRIELRVSRVLYESFNAVPLME